VAILGLAFRGGVDDTRLSPVYDLIDHLLKRGYEDLAVHDPYVERDERLGELGIPLYRDLRAALEGREVVIIATDHPEYAGLTPSVLLQLAGVGRLGIVDGRLVVRDWRNVPPNVVYVGVGRPLVRGASLTAL